MPSPTTTTPALKEWAVAVSALEQGQTIMLLRKGGIREQGGHFSVAAEQVLLYPTFEHQQPRLLKPVYANQVEPVASGWHPITVRIGAWAQITHIFEIEAAQQVEALLPFHIWNEQFICDRLKWKPRSPLYVLLLRVYQLAQSYSIPFQPEYGGCRSWIEVAQPITLETTKSVLSDSDYARQISAIQAALSEAIANPQPS